MVENKPEAGGQSDEKAAKSDNAVKPAAPLIEKKKKKKSNNKLLAGCLAIFLGAFLLIGIVLLIFFAGGGDTLSPLFDLFGITGNDLKGALVALLNLVLGLVAFISFIVFLVGIFKLVTAQKDDKQTKKKGVMMAFLSSFVLFLSVMGLFLTAINLNVPQEESGPSGILTDPEDTTQLTAPVQVTFDATHIGVDRAYEPILYEWDFGDGGARQTGEKVTHTFKKKGSGLFQVALSITLKDTQTSELFKVQQIHNVSITNEQVQASFTTDPAKGKPPLEVSFDASESSDPDGEIISYEWDFDGDGEFDDATGVEARYTFEQLGTYPVSLRVTDNNQEFAVETVDVEVTEGDEPQAVISILDLDYTDEAPLLEKGQTYTFDASESYSPLGTITRYEWDFGDGSKIMKTRFANHAYEKEGVYEVTLTIGDDAKLEGSMTLQLRVGGETGGPRAVITTLPATLRGTVPFRVSFDAGSTTDPNDDVVDYAWDFDGDGSFDDLGETVSHTYTKSGQYFAILKATDAEGNEDTARSQVTVDAQGVQANIKATPTQGEAPLTVKFDASSSSYPDGQIVSYKWNFGDNSPTRLDTAQVTYRYTSIGTFTASVTAVASDGSESTASVPVTVRPVSVAACFEASVAEGPAPLAVTFDPKCSRGSIVKYVWDFAGLDTDRTRKPTFTFEEPGSYPVSLEVSDNQNIIDTFVKTIIVTQ